MNSIILFSIILTVIYLISLYNFKKSLCDSNTRISFLCWNILFIVIILNFFIIGSHKKKKNSNQDKKKNSEQDKKKNSNQDTKLKRDNKSRGFTIFISIIGFILFVFLCYYVVKRIKIC